MTLRDANGNGVSGKLVTLAKSVGSSATITAVTAGSDTTNASGVATFTVTDSGVSPPATTYSATDATDSIPITATATITKSLG